MYTVKKTKYEFGKRIFSLCDTKNEETKECTEDEFCKLIIDGKVKDFEEFTDCSLSNVMLAIMLSKDEQYTVTAKFGDNFSDKIQGYIFEDSYKNEYILGLDDSLELVYKNRVNNAEINNSQKYLISKDGSDLRKIKRTAVAPDKYLTKQELEKFLNYWKEFKERYENGDVIKKY